MSAVLAPRLLVRLLADPISRYIGGTTVGILWVIFLGKSFYFNPITDNQATPWGMISFNVSPSPFHRRCAVLERRLRRVRSPHCTSNLMGFDAQQTCRYNITLGATTAG